MGRKALQFVLCAITPRVGTGTQAQQKSAAAVGCEIRLWVQIEPKGLFWIAVGSGKRVEKAQSDGITALLAVEQVVADVLIRPACAMFAWARFLPFQ